MSAAEIRVASYAEADAAATFLEEVAGLVATREVRHNPGRAAELMAAAAELAELMRERGRELAVDLEDRARAVVAAASSSPSSPTAPTPTLLEIAGIRVLEAEDVEPGVVELREGQQVLGRFPTSPPDGAEVEADRPEPLDRVLASHGLKSYQRVGLEAVARRRRGAQS